MIDILVPVLARPWNVAPLVESLQVTQEPYRLIFIASPLDNEQIQACTGHETWVVDWSPEKADYTKKLNWAYERLDSEWFFQGADDIRFRLGWEQAALQTARRRGKRVIGTNDLHNPQVKRGMGSTHSLIARSYIEEYGSGTLDNTGRVFCELYDHQMVDAEFVDVAKRRNEWAFSRQSIVEHLHPHWGLAKMDTTYRKATRETKQDLRLYMERMGRSVKTPREQRRAEREERRQALIEARAQR